MGVTEPRWSVSCNDPFGRDRALTVLVEDERVVLVPPPGAAAVLSAQQARGLGLTLDQAAVRAQDTTGGLTRPCGPLTMPSAGRCMHRLDMLDHAAGQADASTLLPLARRELRRLADGWRLLLTTHCARPRTAAARRAGWAARRWPCAVWRSAHEQLIGDGLPHRVRTYPLRNPFRRTYAARHLR